MTPMTPLVTLRRLFAAGLILFLAAGLTAQGIGDQLSGKVAVEVGTFKKLVATQPKADLVRLADGWVATLKDAAQTHAESPAPSTQAALDTALDGAEPGYRSNPVFDILNESMVFNFTAAHVNKEYDLQSALESRRIAISRHLAGRPGLPAGRRPGRS